MANLELPTLLTLVMAVFAEAAPAQVKPAQDKPAQGKPAQGGPAPEVRQKVIVLGASLSAGFADPTSRGPDGEVNRTYRLDAAFKKAWPRKIARLYNFGDLGMFMRPEQSGKKQIESAKKRKPDLIVGIDFLVWFGYGSRQGRVAKDEVDAIRLQQLEKGLTLLDGLDCPIVIGDYPDMHDASPHMLPPSMIPNVATLDALNKRLRQWAKARKHIHIFPLAKFVKEAVTKEQVYRFGDAAQVTLEKNFLLQSDRLHATRVGTLVVVLRVTQALPSILPKGHPLLRPKVTFKSLVESAGLTDEIPAPEPIKNQGSAPREGDSLES